MELLAVELENQRLEEEILRIQLARRPQQNSEGSRVLSFKKKFSFFGVSQKVSISSVGLIVLPLKTGSRVAPLC